MTAPQYRLLTFGGLSLTHGEIDSGALVGQRKRLVLLAVLAASNGQGVARDRLLALLWPEADLGRARNALKQFVYTIRREVGDVVVDVNGSLLLNPELIESDVQRFRTSLSAGLLADAAPLYRGPFLDGVYLRDAPEFERWLDDARSALARDYNGVLERLAARATESNDCASAIHWARALAAADPLSTRATLTLMHALDEAGDRAPAVRAGELHVEMLREEFGVDPAPEVRDALRRLRQSVAPNASAAPSSIETSTQAAAPSDVPTSTIAAALSTAPAPAPTRAAGWRPIIAAATVGALLLGVGIVVIAARNPHSARVVALTQITIGQTAESQPVVSPDGKWIAFASTRRGEAPTRPYNMRVYVQSIGGGNAIPVTSDSTTDEQEPTWSPDGSRIAFRTPAGIFAAPALGGTPTPIVAYVGPHPVELGGWSHDGTRIAFADTQGVWVRDLKAGTSMLVTRTGFAPHSPIWSPDDSAIAYVVGTGGVFNVAPSAIWLVRARGGIPERLTEALHLNTSPAFAPDGRSLFLVSDRDGVRDVYELSLRHRAEQPTRLTTGANASAVSLSTDGRTLVYGAAIMRSNLWSAPILPDGPTPLSAARQMTFGDQEIECMSVSPDGRWLFYDSNKNGNQDIYKLSVAGGDPVQLTSDPADDFCASMSADSREIAFYSFRRSGVRHIFTMAADGMNQRMLLEGSPTENQWTPQWNPDGVRLAFTTASSGYRLINIVSRSAANEWTDRRVIPDLPVGSIAWTPDGRRLTACADSGIVTIAPDGSGQHVMVRRSLAGDQERCAFNWSQGASQSTLFYRTTGAGGETRFWAVTESGQPRLVLEVADSTHTSRRGEFATDGKRLFFTMSTDDATIRRLELAR